jgi:hypothetical protein
MRRIPSAGGRRHGSVAVLAYRPGQQLLLAMLKQLGLSKKDLD